MAKKDSSNNQKFKDPYKNSQGLKKLWNYFLNVVGTDKFQEQIKEIRRKYKILIGANTQFYQLPKDVSKSLMEDLENLSNQYGLSYNTWWTSLEPYILTNELVEPMDTDICILCDNINDPDLSKEDIEHYPVSVRISPYASKRDILDYIERFFPYILHTQKDYIDKNIKIGKFKTRKTNIQERNDFIYKNRNLPRKEIMSLVGDKFGPNAVIDYGYIGKIISLEKKKRKEL